MKEFAVQTTTPDLAGVPEQNIPRSKNGRYIDKDGEVWCVAKYFRRRFGVTHYRLFPLLDRVNSSIRGIGGNGHEVVFYNEADLIRILSDHGVEVREPTQDGSQRQSSRKPKGYWTTDRIETESLQIFQNHGKLTEELLKDLDRHDLRKAIYRHYPNRMLGLKDKLREHQVDVDGLRGYGFWTLERIEDEARSFIEEHGDITSGSLAKNGREDLSSAIRRHYPGKLIALKELLQIQTQPSRKFWTVERIFQKGREVYEEHGNLSRALLGSLGLNGFRTAANLYYPGGFFGLKMDLGVESSRKPKGWWTQERIEKASLEFSESYGFLSDAALRKFKCFALLMAIKSKYPGGMKSLIEKLRVDRDSGQELLQSYQAALASGQQISFAEFCRNIEL